MMASKVYLNSAWPLIFVVSAGSGLLVHGPEAIVFSARSTLALSRDAGITVV
jgi:hypothetical protein